MGSAASVDKEGREVLKRSIYAAAAVVVQKKENESGSPPKNDDGTATDQGLAAGDVRSLFLQANKGSVEEAAAHFRRMLAWYREADIGKTCFDVEGKEWSADFVEGGRELLHMMCIDVCMQAADGTMLWVHRDGLIQFDEIMGLPDEDRKDLYSYTFVKDFILRMCLLCESMQIYLDHRSEETGRLVKMIQVRDLKGFNITEVLWNPAAMKRFVDAAAILETAYPETLAQMIIVNPPSGVWIAG
eukprot:g27806.t1